MAVVAEVPVTAQTTRVRSLDILRGAIMVLMAIDHVRVYAGVPAGGPAPGVFFTRWVTHFCAPGFVFLAGTGAYLLGQKVGTAALSRFLVTRGLLLLVLELTVLRTAWTFNVDVWNYNLAGVIWMIGWSLGALAALVWLPTRAVAVIGAVIVCGHNLIGPQLFGGAPDTAPGWFASVAYTAGSFRLSDAGPRVVVLYSLIPWVGLIALGYAFGSIMTLPRESRDRLVLTLGLTMTAAFIVLRTFNLYGDPRPWTSAAPLSFLNTTKYPASLQFLLMTLGPMLALIPWLDRARGRLVTWLAVFGRVPLFYYLLHIPLIHLLALGVSVLRTGGASPWLFGNHPMEPGAPPEGYRWSLAGLYLVFLLAVWILYFPCRWFDGFKRRSDQEWVRLL